MGTIPTNFDVVIVAWAFVEKNKPVWDLVVTNPAYVRHYVPQLRVTCQLTSMQVFGPTIHDVSSAAALNTSQGLLFQMLTGKTDQATLEGMSLVTSDVRDIATMHVLAAQLPRAGGTRSLLIEQQCYAQDIRASSCNTLHSGIH